MGNVRHLIDTDVGPNTCRKKVTLDANGEATWTFATPFTSEPCVSYMFRESADNPPVNVKVKNFTTSGANYTAVTVKGYRAQVLPTLTLLGIGSLLAGVISGVNTAFTALSGFNIYGGSPPNGIVVYLYAAAATE